MKTKKLNLNAIKVDSFITSLNEKKSETVKGGTTAVCASSMPCATVVVATVVIVATATIVATANGNGAAGNNSQCCSYLDPQHCGGTGNTFNPGCVG